MRSLCHFAITEEVDMNHADDMDYYEINVLVLHVINHLY